VDRRIRLDGVLFLKYAAITTIRTQSPQTTRRDRGVDSTRRREAAMTGREDQNTNEAQTLLARILMLSPCHPGRLCRPAASNRSALCDLSDLCVDRLSS